MTDSAATTAPEQTRPRSADRRRTVLATALPLAVFLVLLLLVQERWAPLLSLDRHSTADLHRFAIAHAGFVLSMKGVSTLGTSIAYVVLVARLLLWLLQRRRAWAAAFAVVTMAGGSALNSLVKSAVGRARPAFPDPVSHAGYSSFPSGHAQAVAVAVGVLALVVLPSVPRALRRYVAGAAVTWALLMGFSRVALGVHYPSDVVAGFALGSAWVLACAAAFGTARLHRPSARQAPGTRHRISGPAA